MDATSVDTVAYSSLHSTSKKSDAAANQGFVRKGRLYGEVYERNNFLASAAETFGSFSEGAKLFVKGDTYAKSFFANKVILVIHSGNVAAILGTIPPTSYMECDFSFLTTSGLALQHEQMFCPL